MRVLLVEDDPGLGESMSHALREIVPCEVIWARSGADGILEIEDGYAEIDAVVSDYVLLDEVDGMQVLQAAYRWGIDKRVLVSGNAHAIEIFRRDEAVSHAFVKGFDVMGELFKVLRGEVEDGSG